MEEGWFYEGAGIYRHVWLLKTATLHVARYGTWVRTEIDGDAATLTIETTLTNDGREPADYVVEQAVVGPDGKLSAQKAAPPATVAAGRSEIRTDSLRVSSPRLWSVETPVLYTLVTTIRHAGKAVDRYETPFGIRTIRFDPDAGFFLNGRHVVLKGTNNHQDHAGVGVAVPDALQEYRVNRLKAMGSNAYRASHNPPTPELLDACDRLGMLVIDENRLMGVNEYHKAQLEQMIRRDRNHPGVILWSLGNEEWAIEGNIRGARIASTMQDFARRLDPTRLTTAAISGGWGGISTTIDVAGANYIKNANIDSQHTRFPRQVIVGTEETTTNATRGIYVDDRARCHLAPMEDGVTGGNVEIGWRYYAARPWAAGVFYWTGFDYRGEPTPFGYPAIGSQFGILDACGFPKDSFYYLKSWWGDEAVLHVFPHWNWPGREGQDIAVRIYSNCEEVELSLNGASQGRKKMEPDGHLDWSVKYSPGRLLARGYRGGREIITNSVETTGPAASVGLAPDRAELRADGRDVAVVTVEVRDSRARIVPTAALQVMFSVRGPGRIIGVGNGDPSCHEPDRFVESIRIIPIGEWRAPDPATATGPIVFEAQFDRPQTSDGQPVTLLLNALGERQSVFLNGERLYRDEEPAEARTEIALDVAKLRLSGNILRIEASRFENWSRRESLRQVHPASMRMTIAAKPWARSTFNGLAQVIVQSTGQPGTITLEATSEGLSHKAITLVSRSVTQKR
jgi:beta-galactosidase